MPFHYSESRRISRESTQPLGYQSESVEMSKYCRVVLTIAYLFVIAALFMLPVILSLKYCTRDTEELKSSNCGNVNQTTPPCALYSNALDDKLTKFVKAINIQNTRHVIFNVNLSKSLDELENRTEKDLLNGNKWVWGIGDRGRTFLSFPYDDYLLSITALSYGKHEDTLALNADDINMNDNIFTDCCMSQVLNDIIQKVRNGLARNKTNGKLFPKDEKDILCRQKIQDTPVLLLTKIPGFSLLEIQARHYYDCFPQGRYSCFCWSLTSLILAVEIALVTAVYVLYHYCKRLTYEVPASTVEEPIQGGTSYQLQPEREPNERQSLDQDSAEEYVNILEIPPFPLILWIDSKKKRHEIICFSLIAVSFCGYFIAEICHVARYGLRLQWNPFGLDFITRKIMLDIIITNVACFAGLVALYHVRTQSCQAHCSRMRPRHIMFFSSIMCVVCLFIIFRIVAFLMLMIEVIIFTLAGIAIHIRTVPTIWVNVVVGIFDVIGRLYAFLDHYQCIFKTIYTVGNRIDKEGHRRKVFKNSCQSDTEGQRPEQEKCEISRGLLRKIIENELPLAKHVRKSVFRVLISVCFITLLGVFTYFIDKETNILFIGEYALTVIPLLLFEARQLPRNACSAKNKQHNQSQAMQLAIEEKLRTYANTGEYRSAPQHSRPLTCYNNPAQDQGIYGIVEESAAVSSI